MSFTPESMHISRIYVYILYSMTDNTDKKGSKDLGAVFNEHVRHEFEDHNVEATMKTMALKRINK